jgi:hypothetical protein
MHAPQCFVPFVSPGELHSTTSAPSLHSGASHAPRFMFPKPGCTHAT